MTDLIFLVGQIMLYLLAGVLFALFAAIVTLSRPRDLWRAWHH